MKRIPGRQTALLAALCVTLSACQSPVRAVRVDRTEAHRDLTRSALTTGEPSWPSRDALIERGLLVAFDEQPESALAGLHAAMLSEEAAPDLLFALAELSFLYGQEEAKTEHLLAAAVYAYAFLFPEGGDPPPGPFDPRFRMAADLYNWALTAALASEDGSEVEPRGGTFALPFGEITVAFDPQELRAGSRELYGFVPVAELEVQGLALRYRGPGIGAPLAASTRPIEGATGSDFLVAPRLRVPVTALLRIADARRALVEGQPLAAELELHLAWEDDSVTIGDEAVPLERESSAALALTFTGVPVFEVEIFGFLGRFGLLEERPPLVSASAYRRGLIPVVFVHGTASSVVRWAELFNRLEGDPEIRNRYQFWFFQYESNEPIALSALHLREALQTALAKLDPEGRDPALRRMVLIGHSQGGLLVKMQAVHTGDRIWNAVSSKPLAELRTSDETRDLLQRGLFVEPIPEVSRVVFISTPHRGSFLAGRASIRGLLRRLTILPLQLASVSADLARNRDIVKSPSVPTAVDNMSPRNPFLKGLQTIPVEAPVAAHSIISVKGTGPFEDGNDGVVEYQSAHIDGVESERVVRSPHSCQAHPDTMEEVRRILRKHAAEVPQVGDPETGY